MAQAGNPYNWQQLNQMVASRATAVEAIMADVLQFADWLTAQQDADVAALAGYDAGAWTTLKAVMADLNGHAQIFQGQPQAVITGFGKNVAAGPAYDFRTFCRKVTGGQSG
jgi:hypothetical protein